MPMSLLCNAEEEKGNQRMMEVSRVTEVRFYHMLKKHTVMESIQHIVPRNKPSSLKRQLTDPEELNRSP